MQRPLIGTCVHALLSALVVCCSTPTSAQRLHTLPPPPLAKLRSAREEYARLMSLTGDVPRERPRGGADVPQRCAVHSRQEQRNSERGKPVRRRRAKSAGECGRDHQAGLSKVPE